MDDILEFYIKNFKEQNLHYVHSKGKNIIGLNAGIIGEDSVYRIIRKYTNNIYTDVVLWNKHHTFTTEIDFAFVLNGCLVLVEVKEWYGILKKHKDKSKVYCVQTNINGKTFEQERYNPISAMGGFTKDLHSYLSPNAPDKDTQIRRFIVYSREDVDFSAVKCHPSIHSCTLIGFEEKFEEMVKDNNENPYALTNELPSWDYYFDVKDQNWYKVTILGEEIEFSNKKIKMSDIDIIVFDSNIDDKSKAFVKLNDGNVIEGIIDRTKISLVSKMKFANKRVKCIKFDKSLHKETIKNISTI